MNGMKVQALLNQWELNFESSLVPVRGRTVGGENIRMRQRGQERNLDEREKNSEQADWTNGLRSNLN